MAYSLSQGVDDETPFIVLIGVPSERALQKVISKLQLNNIDHSAFYESDDCMGLTSVATVPLDDGQRSVLRGYKLWNKNQVYPRSSVVRAPSSQEDGGPSFESVRGYQDARVA